MPDQDKNKDVIGGELAVPLSLSLLALLPLLVLLFGHLSSWEVRLGALLIALVFGGLILGSLFPLHKVWEMRQQRWMEQQAKDERELLRDNGKSEAAIRAELEAEYQLKRYKALIELLKQFKELKPEAEDKEDKDYKKLYHHLKEQLTGLIEAELNQLKTQNNT